MLHHKNITVSKKIIFFEDTVHCLHKQMYSTSEAVRLLLQVQGNSTCSLVPIRYSYSLLPGLVIRDNGLSVFR